MALLASINNRHQVEIVTCTWVGYHAQTNTEHFLLLVTTNEALTVKSSPLGLRNLCVKL